MLATSENGLFPGHNYLLTTGTDDTLQKMMTLRKKAAVHQVTAMLATSENG